MAESMYTDKNHDRNVGDEREDKNMAESMYTDKNHDRNVGDEREDKNMAESMFTDKTHDMNFGDESEDITVESMLQGLLTGDPEVDRAAAEFAGVLCDVVTNLRKLQLLAYALKQSEIVVESKYRFFHSRQFNELKFQLPASIRDDYADKVVYCADRLYEEYQKRGCSAKDAMEEYESQRREVEEALLRLMRRSKERKCRKNRGSEDSSSPSQTR